MSIWRRASTLHAGFLGGGLAIMLANGDLASAYEQFQRYVGMLTAGVAALFFMGLFMKRVNGVGAMCGLVVSYAAVFWIDFAPWPCKPHLLLYGFIGMAVCVVVATVASPLARERK